MSLANDQFSEEDIDGMVTYIRVHGIKGKVAHWIQNWSTNRKNKLQEDINRLVSWSQQLELNQEKCEVLLSHVFKYRVQEFSEKEYNVTSDGAISGAKYL
eukprot:g41447.t1